MKNCRYEVVEAVSKNGKPYKQLHVIFANGYVFTTFLNDEQHMLIRYAELEQERQQQGK